jgi:glutaredoxin-related protein
METSDGERDVGNPVTPPEGFSRWSMRLLADKVVELDYIDSVSHETIRQVLKKRS